jgi:CHAT domain-containing protein
VDRRPYQTDRNYAAAIQQAQLAVSGNPQTAHPCYWAPFILIGAR